MLPEAPPAQASAGEGVSSERPGVLVETDKARYASDETLVIHISNRLETAITTRDQRSFCSVIALERRHEAEDRWVEIRNCLSGAPPREVTLEPGSTITIELQVSQDPLGGLEPGLYRAALAYSHGHRVSAAPEDSHVARSEPFRIEE